MKGFIHTPLCQASCVCRSTADWSAGADHEAREAAEVMEDRPSGVCLQGPAPNRPQAALAKDRCRER